MHKTLLLSWHLQTEKNYLIQACFSWKHDINGSLEVVVFFYTLIVTLRSLWSLSLSFSKNPKLEKRNAKKPLVKYRTHEGEKKVITR